MTEAVLTVSQLSEYIKMLLDSDRVLRKVYVRGEISNLKNYSGNLYFSLKDQFSVINLVMFSSYTQKLKFALKDGMNVIVCGSVSAYPKFGRYQLYAVDVQPDGIGALYTAYEQLKERLEEEGLFGEDIKKAIPEMPSAIGVVTSPKGAVIHDIINVAKRRCSGVKIVLYPSLVQGDGAEKQLIDGIRFFNSKDAPAVDTVIIGRGGGSIEDLWAFNSEALAREIRASHLPVISAVGHETDYTICDFASDMRAPTPSAAAEIAIPSEKELKKRLAGDLEALTDLIYDMTGRYRERLNRLSENKLLSSPLAYIASEREMLEGLKSRLTKGAKDNVDRFRAESGHLAKMLSAVSPLNVLSRGYGLVFDQDGRAVRSADGVEAKDRITVRLKDGYIKAEVLSRHLSKDKEERKTKRETEDGKTEDI